MYVTENATIVAAEGEIKLSQEYDSVSNESIEKPLQAELIQYDKQESLCWIEVADGMRVLAKVSSSSIKAASLNEGDEFFWYPRLQVAERKEKPTEDSEERERLKRKLELLKHFKTGLESE